MSIAATTEFETSPANPVLLPFVAAIGCAALADWLFYGWSVGISLALFYSVVGIVAIAVNGVHAPRRVQLIMTVVFIAGLIALIEQVDTLSVIVASLATAFFVLVTTAREPSSWPWRLLQAATVPLRGPFQLIGDATHALQHMKLAPGWPGSLVGWIVPLSILGIFLALLSSANPLIEAQLARIDLRVLLDLLSPWRTAFWIMVIGAIWPLLHRRTKPKKARPRATDGDNSEPHDVDHLFGEAAMTRSLILFNILFALQSALDLTYLWAGAKLPDGMSHAEYAHRGAYPLIVTALLAAGFALVAMRPNGPAESSSLIRPLVLAWIGQNILLVISSIFRLDLYIAAFSLTYLRLAAFIWMGLVAIGLALMLVQIVGRKSIFWLLTVNAMSLAIVLYGCCFLNAPRLVASYNVEHSRQVSGKGPDLDLDYLAWLGSPEVMPPLEAHLSQIPEMQSGTITCCGSPAYRIYATRYLAHPENWRSWGFRRWRLERYFANTARKYLTFPHPIG